MNNCIDESVEEFIKDIKIDKKLKSIDDLDIHELVRIYYKEKNNIQRLANKYMNKSKTELVKMLICYRIDEWIRFVKMYPDRKGSEHIVEKFSSN